MNKCKLNKTIIGVLFLILIFIIAQQPVVKAEPTGAKITSSTTDEISLPAASLTTAGGSMTTMVLNITQQNPRWKAYVGNVTGILTLDDGNNYSIYDWSLTSISGEVYASRNASISWSNIACAQTSLIENECSVLNHTVDAEDSINTTFVARVHKTLYVGTTKISNSTCKSIATYINDTAQTSSENALFQEVLLQDGTSFIYATILEQNEGGFNNGLYDFQMIVAEDEFLQTPTTYYFYAEIG
ncbi:MAG: hypothetical protein ABIC91_02605 [Nanoarchaeota archaeon]|nr:hypothetical protein [Nanoarchaeota archaeon]MBU1029852.1 hypothetical protein [Nanoarchaeota archaeon]MBU1849422.1 hypothetical protein [Nanoarchaeota archaeon]